MISRPKRLAPNRNEPAKAKVLFVIRALLSASRLYEQRIFTAQNPFATEFNIVPVPATCGITGAGACDFNDAFGMSGNGQTLMIDVSIPHVTHVFTLMNAYAPPFGAQLATIEFIGSGGATQTFPLVAGQNIRDFYHGSFANTLANGIPGVHALRQPDAGANHHH